MSKIEQRENRILVNADSILCMVHSLNDLMDGVCRQCCWSKDQGILNGKSITDVPYEEEARNGRDWILSNYGTVSGAIAVAKDITGLLSEVAVNYHITVTE